MKCATAREISHVWHRARDLCQQFAPSTQGWNRSQKAGCVRMGRIVKQVFDRPGFHNLSSIHDRQPITEIADHPQIMGNEQNRQSMLAGKIPQQNDNLRLNRDIKRCGRLVCDQKLRLAAKRHGDHDSLELPSRNLMWIFAKNELRIGNADVCQRAYRCPPGGGGVKATDVSDGMYQLLSDGEKGIEGLAWILKDHGGNAAAHVSNRCFWCAYHFLPIKADASRDPPRFWDKAKAGECSHRLATARFADEPQDFTGSQLQVATSHGFDGSVSTPKPYLKITDL